MIEFPYLHSPPTLRTLEQFSQEFPAFPLGRLRWLLANRHTNGLQPAVLKIGKRILIDVDRFFVWAYQNGQGKEPNQSSSGRVGTDGIGTWKLAG